MSSNGAGIALYERRRTVLKIAQQFSVIDSWAFIEEMTPRIRSVFVVSPAGSSFGFLSLSSAAPDFSPPDCDFLLPACRQVRFPASAEAARPGQSLTDFLPPIFAVFIQASVFVSVPSSAGVLHYSLFCSPQWISSYRLLLYSPA
jgi:hypothetical protein